MSNDNVKLNKAINLLNQKGFNGLIIYSNGTRSVSRPSYLHYFSEFKPLGPKNTAIISKSGDITLLVEPQWDSIRVSKKSWISDVRGSLNFIKDLTDIMREYKIAGYVGVVGSGEMTQDIYDAINKEAEVKLADSIVEEIAREKTEKELDIVRKLGRIADVGFKAFFDHCRVGIREYELLAEMEFAMRSAGADDNFCLMSSGKHNYAMHTPTDRRLAEGDILISEITPVCEGQFIQLCRTVVLGKPSPVLSEKYNILVHALDDSLKQVKPGNPASFISTTMNKVISEAGYAKYCYPPYMRVRGHGSGVGSFAPGRLIDDDTKAKFERHQVVIVHPNQYIPETGYLACGETVLVTDTGMERLIKTETKAYIKGV